MRLRIHDDDVGCQIADAAEILIGKLYDADGEILAGLVFSGHLRQRRRAFTGGQHVQ